MDVDEVITRLQGAVDEAGGVGPWSNSRCSPSYVYDVLAKRTAPGPLILEPLGLEAVTVYRVKS